MKLCRIFEQDRCDPYINWLTSLGSNLKRPLRWVPLYNIGSLGRQLLSDISLHIVRGLLDLIKPPTLWSSIKMRVRLISPAVSHKKSSGRKSANRFETNSRGDILSALAVFYVDQGELVLYLLRIASTSSSISQCAAQMTKALRTKCSGWVSNE